MTPNVVTAARATALALTWDAVVAKFLRDIRIAACLPG